MSSSTCHHCGCSEIDIDPARGDAVCTNCGSVLVDTIIVNEVQFEEGAHGGARAIGQLVSSEGQSSSGLNLGFQHGMGKESRMVTLQNARKRITHLAEQLRLNQHCIDTAYNFYKMALCRQLTRGRKNSHVIAACLYIVCRTEGTSHMLLDLSDILQVNVYELGKTYLRLSRDLCINIPAVDPCLYILRFAHRLEFGDKTHEVSTTALRLVQRMKRDWMHAGRRPSGLCGAALLVAGRVHNFNRTVKDVIKVVKVCETTLRKRLIEFGDTPSSRLTLDEFMSVDLEEEQDPPSFKEARRKQKIEQLEEPYKIQEMEEEIDKLRSLIDRVVESSRKKLRGPYAKYAEISGEDNQDTASSEKSAAEQFILEETLGSVLNSEDTYSQENNEAAEVSQNQNNTQNSEASAVSSQQVLKDILLPSRGGNQEVSRRKQFEALRPTAASLGLTDTIEECMRVEQNNSTEEQEDGALDLTGLDDAELDAYIMTEAEAKLKAKLWMQVHAEYLQEVQEREKRKAKALEENAQKPEQKKRKRSKRGPIKANTAGEAIEKMLQEKKISNKINYEVLRSLSSKDTEETPVNSAHSEAKDNSTSIKRKNNPRKKPNSNPAPSPVLNTSNIRGLLTSIVGKEKLQLSLVEDDISNTPSDSAKKTSTPPHTEPPVKSSVSSSAKDDNTLREEEEEEFYEEEEEECIHLSAAQLLNQYRGEDDNDYGGEDQDYYGD